MIQAELQSGKLDNKFIIEAVISHDRTRFQRNAKYVTGDNPKILSRTFADTKAPHNNTPVPYARKIANTVAGYMYKPGLITYMSDKPGYIEAIQEVFYQNDEDVKSSLLGRAAGIDGIAFELHYTDGTMPRFAKVPAEELIPVYDYAVEPKLIAGIRNFKRGKDWKVEVYYSADIDYFTMKETAVTGKYTGVSELILEDSKPHLYGQVPVAVFDNNEELVGDFEPVIPLIDAYDVLISDSMNEFDRFAYAYLVLKGLSMKKEDADIVKQLRMFTAPGSDWSVEFLTKDIPFGFIEFMTTLIRKEIHKQSHVPDFSEVATGTFTGAALDRVLYDFELVASVKEAMFKKGLYKRLELIDGILRKRGGLDGEVRDVEIIMHRNKPTSLIEMGDAMIKYAGIISDKTLIENFAPFVKDADEEMKQRAEESAARMPDVFDEDDDGEDDRPDAEE